MIGKGERKQFPPYILSAKVLGKGFASCREKLRSATMEPSSRRQGKSFRRSSKSVASVALKQSYDAKNPRQ